MKLRLPTETTDDLDMTPMIDVVFQLIIFFMVASSFVDEAKVFKVALPRGEAPQTIAMDEARKITVTADGIVARSGATDRNDHYAALTDLVADLKTYKQSQDSAGKQAVVVIEGDRDAKYQRIIQVWNAIRSAGITVKVLILSAFAGSAKEMMRVTTVYRDLPLRAAGFTSRQQGARDLKVVALFEPEDPTVRLTSAMVGLIDEKGTLKAQWTAQPNELAGAPLVAALTAAPGKYRMRVAATDSSGKGGTTDYDLSVELPDAAPVKTSHMLLGVGQGGFAPKLAFTSADAAAIGFIEIYNVAKDAKLEATFEIIKADGEVMGSGQGTIGAGSAEDARIAYGGFGIATLEPGDYTMRATINVDGKQAGVATRTLRKLK